MIVLPQCSDCKHYKYDKKNKIDRCDAFKDGIPEDVFTGKVSHKKHIEGDSGFLYEKEDG